MARHGSLRPMAEGLGRLLYRIVPNDPPILRDFMSYEELGVKPRRPLSPVDRDRWRGVSHYASFAAAMSATRAAPRLGRYIAAIRVPADAVVRVEQTGRDRDHVTVWADAATLLGWVESVVAVEGVH